MCDHEQVLGSVFSDSKSLFINVPVIVLRDVPSPGFSSVSSHALVRYHAVCVFVRNAVRFVSDFRHPRNVESRSVMLKHSVEIRYFCFLIINKIEITVQEKRWDQN